MKKLAASLLICLFVTCLFALDLHSYVDGRASYSDKMVGVDVEGKFVFKADGKSTIRPYAGAGIGFAFDPKVEPIDFTKGSLLVNANAGAQYRFYKNVYAFGGLDLGGFFENKKDDEFKFNSVALDLGAGISDGSLGAEVGALAGYKLSEDKGFLFKPYAKVLVGLGGNKVYKYNEEGEAVVADVVSDNLNVNSIRANVAFLPDGEKTDGGIMFSAAYSSDCYFRFNDSEKKVAPFAGFSSGFGYGELAFTFEGQAYGGMGYKPKDNVILSLSGGMGASVGFLKGFKDASEDGKVLLLAFGWVIPSGYEMDFFASPSVTYLTNSKFGVKAGCDLGIMMWGNAFAWTKKSRASLGGGTGFFARPYISLAFGN